MAKRKLIEVAIPLDPINAACKADKDRKTGTIRNLHKWFAPMPLPAWRALLFATLVDDPDDPQQRDRLMGITESLITTGGELPSPEALRAAREEIARSWPSGAPTVLDPFCGGGSTLIEAQRLGTSTWGSDLNPVPVLITKVLTELLPRVAGEPALRPARGQLPVQASAHAGVVADVLHYARIIQERARAQLAVHYPETASDRRSIAWLWCRTVNCPNPACGAEAPLIDSTWLSKKPGEERHLEVIYPPGELRAQFLVRAGKERALAGTVERGGATCAACGNTMPFSYLRSEGQAGRLGLRMTTVVVQRGRERLYEAATDHDEHMGVQVDVPTDPPEVPMDPGALGMRVPQYGLKTQADLYAPRPLAVLAAFADSVRATQSDIEADGGDEHRVRVVMALLGLCVGKLAQHISAQVRWYIDSRSGVGKATSAFGRHDLPMTWDFAEPNPFGGSVGDWLQIADTALRAVAFAPDGDGIAVQADARVAAQDAPVPLLVATDPPYFDQIGYADMSDYFYVWLRRALRPVFPDLFATVATPKGAELIAATSRFGGDKQTARQYFVDGFTDTFRNLASAQTPDAPMLIVYAFKERGQAVQGLIAPGWEAILEALVAADLTVVGTWPIHGTGSKRMRQVGTNALATYVVLVCRPRPTSAQRITRSELTRLLRTELVPAVAQLQHANIAPVDLAQAVIGPGMQVFSRHSSVIETDGSRVGVADALALINRTLAEVLDEQEGDLDPDSRWAVTWYEDHGFEAGTFGDADQLARAKGIAVDALVQAGIITSGASRVALIPRNKLPAGWDPATDRRATAWEAVQYLVRALLDEGGEMGAAELYAQLGALADPARELAYRLFQIAEKKGRIDEAIAYNILVASWTDIARLADELPRRAASTSTTEAMF